METIGIYGGTFDPIHYGHLRSALEVVDKLNLTKMRFIPAFQPVHKAIPSTTAEERCTMVKIAIQAQPKFVLDTIEVEKQVPSYTIDTLRILSKINSGKRLALTLGMDAFSQLDSWKNWQSILQVCSLVVMTRAGKESTTNAVISKLLDDRLVDTFSSIKGEIILVDVTQLDISSSDIRSELAKQNKIDYLVPAKVQQYIYQQKLYGSLKEFK